MAASDFAVARPSGAPHYIVSVRPLSRRDEETAAIAAVFVRDPSRGSTGSIGILSIFFGLTEAEASLAEALCAGVTPGDYALTRSVSLNTVYTHLRRIKDKTRCRRMPELIRKLNDTVAPARHE